MALLSRITCRQCGGNAHVGHGANQPKPDICNTCASKNADEKRHSHLQSLSSLTIEERLHRIEEWIYDYRPYRGEPRY